MLIYDNDGGVFFHFSKCMSVGYIAQGARYETLGLEGDKINGAQGATQKHG